MGMISGGRRGMGDMMSGMGGGMGGGSGARRDDLLRQVGQGQVQDPPIRRHRPDRPGRVQDFLVELENSPMSIQVKDFELVRAAVASDQARERRGDSPRHDGRRHDGRHDGRRRWDA